MIGATIAFAHARNSNPVANPSKALTAKATKTMIMMYSHSERPLLSSRKDWWSVSNIRNRKIVSKTPVKSEYR
jgi:hypothetical protein